MKKSLRTFFNELLGASSCAIYILYAYSQSFITKYLKHFTYITEPTNSFNYWYCYIQRELFSSQRVLHDVISDIRTDLLFHRLIKYSVHKAFHNFFTVTNTFKRSSYHELIGRFQTAK